MENQECKVKGSLIHGLLYYMQRKWGKMYVDALKLSFDKDSIKDGKMYPYSYIREIHRHLMEKTKGDVKKGFMNAGKSVVEATIEGKFFVNYIVKKRPLEKTFKDLVKEWEKESFNNVFSGKVEKEGNVIRITLDPICDDKGEEICFLNLGGLKSIVEVTGKKATVEHTECVFHGGEHCVYEIKL